MKKAIVATAFLFLSTAAYSMSATTNSGYFACLKKEWLDNMTSFVVAKDQGSIQAYLDTQKCLSIKGGLRVTVTESPGMFGGTAGFIFQGVNFWTYREALNYGD